jgi:site-specific DNA recombinase
MRARVRIIYQWYAYANLTIDGIVERLAKECIPYSSTVARWCRSKIHNVLRDRAYIGEVKYRGQWHPGKQQPLVDRVIWEL